MDFFRESVVPHEKILIDPRRGGNQRAEPSAKLSNRDGARVTVELGGGRKLVREHQCGQGVFAQNSARLLIGIADATSADRVTVRWPSMKLQTVTDVAAGTALVFSELEADRL